jgi:chemotaxis protein histidine kinase CheA/ActR/RegA family two-component response regulator
VRNDLDDLLPLFLEEAGSRLERLATLFELAADDPGAAVQVRRELHALKGAARLMGLTEVANLCHRAEDHLMGEGSAAVDEVRKIADRVASIVENLQDDAADPPPGTVELHRERPTAAEPVIRGGSGELRVATEIVDGLAERSAQMRVAAKAGSAPIQRLFELAAAADGGRNRDAPGNLVELGASLRSAALEIEAANKTLHRLSEEQLDSALRIQVQPLRPFLRTLARHTRELARSLGKEVKVSTSGGAVQLDRRILKAIREAALHLAHNAVDHGIENAETRRKAGKRPEGRIHFGAEADGDRVRLVAWDDGRGIDAEAVVRAAVKRGLVTTSAAANLSPDESYQLLQLPGFTTRDLATDVSGRGIGLDAVAASFRSIGGDIWIRSTLGEGTRVTVEVPVARRGERVLVVQLGETILALPSSAARSFSRLSPEKTAFRNGRALIRLGRRSIAAVFLSELFGEPAPTHATLIETVISGTVIGIVVDAIVGEEEVFVRPLPEIAGAPGTIEGAALLSSGDPVAVLSLAKLGPLDLGEFGGSGGAEPAERPVLRVLLTDDTAATREMMRRLLEDAGFDVTPVESAEDALRLIEGHPFDCVVTGVELPGLSGIDLTRRVRSSDLHSDLPVVVVSTRDRPADRLAGLEAGADAYLTKQGLEPEHLAELIHRIAGDTPPGDG